MVIKAAFFVTVYHVVQKKSKTLRPPQQPALSPARLFAGGRVAAGRVRVHGGGEYTTFPFAEGRVVDRYTFFTEIYHS